MASAERAERTLAQVAADASGLAIEGAGIAQEFAAFRDQVKAAVTQIAREVKRQKDALEALAGEKPAEAEEAPEAEAGAGADGQPAQEQPQGEQAAERPRRSLRRRLEGEPE